MSLLKTSFIQLLSIYAAYSAPKHDDTYVVAKLAGNGLDASDFLISLSAAQEQEDSILSCEFTRDCKTYEHCQTIQDAYCVCNFGECIITGNPFFEGTECNEYTDCACKNKPESCFCKDGFCEETPWECHEDDDCITLDKCDGLNCTCTGNLCESDCVVDDDCKDFYCNRAIGYMCKCENSLCAYKKKVKECKNISDCVDQGKCLAEKPCACTQEYCTLPWWVQEADAPTNCRSNQDCDEIILNCEGIKCSCLNMSPVNDWEMRGTCGSNLTQPEVY